MRQPRFAAQMQFDWFTSDPHFGHENVIKFNQRPYADKAQMDAALVANWNRVVKPTHKILCLGDVTLSQEVGYLSDLFSRLNGEKYIIGGNHDYWLGNSKLAAYWNVLPDLWRARLTFRKGHERCVVLSHFPLMTWERAWRGAWMLHGHCHGSLDWANEGNTRLDLGIDATFKWCGEYRPVSRFEVDARLRANTYQVVDHHGATEGLKALDI